MKNKLFLKVFWIFFLSVGILFGGKKDIKFERISLEEGLPNNEVHCILQCSRGFIWFGTQGGLCRYDGYEFKTYRHDRRDKTTLSHEYVTALIEDRHGMLWVSTFRGGINRFDPGQETFTRFGYDPGNPGHLSHRHVKAIYEDASGTIWVGTYKGLDRLVREKGTFIHYRHDPGIPESLSDNYVLQICEDARGNFWVGTKKGGLNRFDREKGTFKRFQHEPGNPASLSNNMIVSMHPDSDGSIWIGTYIGGLNRFDPETETCTRYLHDPKDPGTLGDNQVMAVFKDSARRLWVGTPKSGLNKFDPQTGTFTRFRHDPANPESISANSIQSIFEDRSGVLWVGTLFGGVNKFDGKPGKFIHYKNIYNDPGSLSHNVVLSFYEDRFGDVWIGTFGGGLNRFNREDETFSHFKHEPGNPRSLSSNRVCTIAEDKRGSLWVATPRSGLNKFHRETGNFTRFKHDPADPFSLSTNQVLFLYKDREGSLWIGTYGGGLNRLVYKREAGSDSGREREAFAYLKHDPKNPNSLGSDMIQCILEDRLGMLWLAAMGVGLTRYDRKRGIFTHFRQNPDNPGSVADVNIFTMYEDSKGRLWVGTAEEGLDRFDREREVFIHYTKADGLPDNCIGSILEDYAGNLWISTNSGLCRFNPETGGVRTYDSRDGLQSNEFSNRSCLKEREGRMYFGGINGFNVFRPGHVKDNPHIPPLVLTSFKIFEKEVKLSPPIWCRKEIRLPYDENFFSFQFAALDFTQPGKNRYAYKMEGLDDNWIEAGNRRYVNFTQLDPGKYVFKVRGSNNDNLWNQEGTSIIIDIIPPFWMTWWFKVLLALVFAAVSYTAIGFARRYAFLFAFWKKKSFIGHYRLVDKIASGGMGIIYKAEDLLDKSRTLALKVMREEYFTDKVRVKRFKNEAAIIDQLNHPNIVKIVERGEHHGQLYMAMELVEGQNLSEFLQTEKKIEVSTAANIIAQVTDALVSVHKKNIIHRDLKPENIMITRKRENPYFVTLLDFGLARARHLSRLTQTGMVMGTVYYLSPEQVKLSEVSCASDVYSLGIICFEMFTAKKPFDGPTNEIVVNNILEKEPGDLKEARPDIPGKLSETIIAMLSKKPGDRPTMEEVLKAFQPSGG